MQNPSLLKRLMVRAKNKPQKVLNYSYYLIKFAQNYIQKTTCFGYVVGLSGGIDSALTLAILSQTKGLKIMGVFVDIESNPRDRVDAESLKPKYNFEYKYINLTKQYQELVKVLGIENNQMAQANLKVRLRTNALYALANANMLLVCGTTNADERLVGYFTKHGDWACDVNIMYYLTKAQIRYLATKYEVPESIIEKAPSAGLSEDQTDEGDMGITYQEIDHYLSFAVIDPIQDSKITTRYITNKHKVNAPVHPKKFMSLRNCK